MRKCVLQCQEKRKRSELNSLIYHLLLSYMMVLTLYRNKWHLRLWLTSGQVILIKCSSLGVQSYTYNCHIICSLWLDHAVKQTGIVWAYSRVQRYDLINDEHHSKSITCKLFRWMTSNTSNFSADFTSQCYTFFFHIFTSWPNIDIFVTWSYLSILDTLSTKYTWIAICQMNLRKYICISQWKES